MMKEVSSHSSNITTQNFLGREYQQKEPSIGLEAGCYTYLRQICVTTGFLFRPRILWMSHSFVDFCVGLEPIRHRARATARAAHPTRPETSMSALAIAAISTARNANTNGYADTIGALALLIVIAFASISSMPNFNEVDAGINGYTSWIAEHAPGK